MTHETFPSEILQPKEQRRRVQFEYFKVRTELFHLLGELLELGYKFSPINDDAPEYDLSINGVPAVGDADLVAKFEETKRILTDLDLQIQRLVAKLNSNNS